MTDSRLEQTIAVLLRSGVLVAGTVVLLGGVLYVAKFGGEAANYHRFVPQAAEHRLLYRIVAGALLLKPASVIQLGVLLLIATPILRVAVAMLGFAMERDKQYVVIAGLVLAVLIYSLISGV